MIYIKVPDMNDSMSSISIDKTLYYLRFTYNETYDYWSFSVYNDDKKPIFCMTKIVPNFPLRHWYTDVEAPNGVFGCISNKPHIGRQTFNKGEAEFIFIPSVELKGKM